MVRASVTQGRFLDQDRKEPAMINPIPTYYSTSTDNRQSILVKGEL